MIYISIISHGHSSLIEINHQLFKIAKLPDVSVIVKDNIGEESLRSTCEKNDLFYISDEKGLGFGANNNYIFELLLAQNNLINEDFFLVLNPDVFISFDEFIKLKSIITNSAVDFCTIDLFKDDKFLIRDPFIRRFPNMIDFFSSFILKRNRTIVDRSAPVSGIEWCAGSFMCIKASVYHQLKGFDESYFMYCEDIDICYRAHRKNYKISYIENVRAIHLAQHSNRKIFSKHFYWHIKGVFRFLIKKHTSFLTSVSRIK